MGRKPKIENQLELLESRLKTIESDVVIEREMNQEQIIFKDIEIESLREVKEDYEEVIATLGREIKRQISHQKYLRRQQAFNEMMAMNASADRHNEVLKADNVSEKIPAPKVGSLRKPKPKTKTKIKRRK